MRSATVVGLDYVPAGGEAGLPNNWSQQNAGAYCIDRWRQRDLPGIYQAFDVGRLMGIPPGIRALQLRPDGLRGAWEVGLIFRPLDSHIDTYGETRVVARAGAVVPVPACSAGDHGPRFVEVYPMCRPENGTLDRSHYARFSLLEHSDMSDAIRPQPPASAHFEQFADMDMAANSFGTDKTVPWLEHVPCKHMRHGMLVCPPPVADTGHLVEGYVVAVAVTEPAWCKPLPLGIVLSGEEQDRVFEFPIPEGARRLRVFAWQYFAATSIDVSASGGIRLLLSERQQSALQTSVRHSGRALAVAIDSFSTLCSISRPQLWGGQNDMMVRAQNLDAADAANFYIQYLVNLADKNGDNVHDRIESLMGAVPAASQSTFTPTTRSWDATVVFALAATNVVDEARATIYCGTAF